MKVHFSATADPDDFMKRLSAQSAGIFGFNVL